MNPHSCLAALRLCADTGLGRVWVVQRQCLPTAVQAQASAGMLQLLTLRSMWVQGAEDARSGGGSPAGGAPPGRPACPPGTMRFAAHMALALRSLDIAPAAAFDEAAQYDAMQVLPSAFCPPLPHVAAPLHQTSTCVGSCLPAVRSGSVAGCCALVVVTTLVSYAFFR